MTRLFPTLAQSSTYGKMIDFSISEGVIYIDGRKVDGLLPVKNAIQFEKIVLVLLNESEISKTGRNVAAVTSDCDILWLIEKSCYSGSEIDSYVRVWTDGKEVYARSWFGITHKIDIMNGKVIAIDFNRF